MVGRRVQHEGGRVMGSIIGREKEKGGRRSSGGGVWSGGRTCEGRRVAGIGVVGGGW